MKFNTKATNLELTPAIQDYLDKKLSMIEKHITADPDSVMCNAEVGKISNHHMKGDVFKAEINLKIAGKQHYAVSEKDDLYAAIDEVKDQVIHEITHSKEKQTTLLRRGGQRIKDMIKGFRYWRK